MCIVTSMATQPKSRARARTRGGARQRGPEGLFLVEEIERLRAWALAACAQGVRNGALLVTFLGTAGRRFEVGALRTGDVREGPGGFEVYFPETKGGDSATVPVTPETWTALRAWIAGKPARGESAGPLTPLFVSERGGFMHTTTIWRAFKDAVQEAGIKRTVGVHASRHAAGFLLLRATNDLVKVQRFLRHKNLTTTSAWYAHIHMPDLRAGLAKAGL